MPPLPKPAHLRQRTNKKSTFALLNLDGGRRKVPAIPNPNGREWHPLTVQAWKRAWQSPMAELWLEADIDALGRLALLWDECYRAEKPMAAIFSEIRMQEQRFGLTPLDRSRLQWEIKRAEEVKPAKPQKARATSADPRAALMAG